MRVYPWPGERPTEDGRLVAVGGFDGLHLGHQAVVAELCRRARERGWRSCLVTFEPVPAQVFAAGPPHNRRLTTAAERLALLSRFRLDEVCILDFSGPELRRLTAAEFIAGVLREGLGATGVCGSRDHRMGSDRAGWTEIAEAARSLGMEAVGIEAVADGEAEVSSTAIRELVWAGDVAAARELLGRDYTLTGITVPGAGLGRELGFATANLETPPEKLLPAEGVYTGWMTGADLGDGPLDVPGFGRAWPAATNVGRCPTLSDEGAMTVEAHAVGWEGELYGSELTVGLTARLRGEERFASVEELRAQVGRDVEVAVEIATRLYGREASVAGAGGVAGSPFVDTGESASL
jgi:riboflavin kinase/FMN adenylyltransferase